MEYQVAITIHILREYFVMENTPSMMFNEKAKYKIIYAV